MKPFIRSVALAAALALASSACFGSFPLTSAVYKLNKGIDDKIVRSVVFWAFVIVPVYAVVATGDSLLLNVIEFWTNEKIVLGKAEDGSEVEIAKAAEGVARVRQLKDGALVAEFELVRVGQTGALLRQLDGAVAQSVELLPDGSLALTGPGGVKRVPRQTVASLMDRAAAGADWRAGVQAALAP